MSISRKLVGRMSRFHSFNHRISGWNDWILSPSGFYANYCSGSCSNELDENYQMMKLSSKDQSMIPEPGCAPNYYGSIDMIVALTFQDIRKTRIHGMRALSCSCT